MAKIIWYVNRLRAMSIREIFWRLDQKKLAKAERQTFGKEHTQITERVFYQGKEDLIFHVENLPIAESAVGNMDAGSLKRTKEGIWHRCISLLGDYDYETYRKDWHAGFQTKNAWPLVFSYDLEYKQKDEIGDARTNWELNRHFQFALLACNYYQSGNLEFLTELSELFEDWNRKNPFLQGISWTSVMEAAIRDINWIYTLGFLQRALSEQYKDCVTDTEKEEWEKQKKDAEALCEKLRIGIVNMTQYIADHYSRYSSANNHVIVEAAAMGIAGIVMEQEAWEKTAFSIFDREIVRQNYADGVNKEVSLHYQSFFMEAAGLLMLTMERAGKSIPVNWQTILQKMSRYVADCQGSYGETVVFGDDDEGKILDLEGAEAEDRRSKKALHRSHYQYVLQLMSLILPERYAEKISDRTLLCLVSKEESEKIMQKEAYTCSESVCYEEGGVSLLRSKDKRVLIGIDHGELGFGSIAAHGHADALSFQMYLDGKPVFADAGTYIYHTDLESRNAFRKTENHNTVTINGKDQSEMLGAFLWGKRAKTTLLWHNLKVGNSWKEAAVKDGSVCYVEAEHDGYAPVIHRRKFVFDGNGLKIYDSLLHVQREISYGIHFLLGENIKIYKKESSLERNIVAVLSEDTEIHLHIGLLENEQQQNQKKEVLPAVEIVQSRLSGEYGKAAETKKICIRGTASRDITVVTAITWENQK